MELFGHRQIGSNFQKLIKIEPNGFIFENKHYDWSDIKQIKRYDSILWSLFFYQGGTPRAYIYLKDRKCIKIRGRILEKEGEKLEVNFLNGRSKAYIELIELLAEKHKNYKT